MQSLQLGPEIAYLLAANARTDDMRQSLDRKFYRDIDLRFVMGLAYHGPSGLHISGRVNLGLIHFWRFNVTNNVGNNDIVRAGKHQVFQLSMGYSLFRRI